ncbi:hypothetical protein COX25_01290 [bacterium (Candidatus Howlettbacteria) CG23_combo_of_CG06-09_8_20_14_all_37_9]|nr:MAG: hypothetical protein COX25_01290 [bacterium (Candidatus Howlettbacteria) CG23_combo_of_CG06-09_8_20_14_all_37_9]
MSDMKLNYAKLIFLFIIVISIWPLLKDPSAWIFLHNVDLVFHEAGHFILMFFGEAIHILGGTIIQLAVPITCAVAFYLRKDFYSVGIMLMWLGESVIYTSVYMGDAVKRVLPLLGGNTDGHDFYNFFSMFGILDYTDSISLITKIIGYLIIFGGFVFAFLNIFDKEKEENLEDLAAIIDPEFQADLLKSKKQHELGEVGTEEDIFNKIKD